MLPDAKDAPDFPGNQGDDVVMSDQDYHFAGTAGDDIRDALQRVIGQIAADAEPAEAKATIAGSPL
jgi:hypothetical protein